MHKQFIPNYPHLTIGEQSPRVALDRAPASPGALAAVMAAIENEDDEAIERLAAQHARPGAPRTLSLQRGGAPFSSNPGHDRDPAVMRARLAQLGGGRARSTRPTAIVQLKKDPVALPDANAKLDELIKFMSDADPEFAKLDATTQHERARALRDAIAKVLPTVAASRGGVAAKPVLCLSAFSGRNPSEQAINALRAADPAFSRVPWADQVKASSELIRFFHGRIV